MTALARNLLSANASVDADGHLHIAGLSALDLAAEFGTPAFIYATDPDGDGVADVKRWLAAHLPVGPWLYPADQMSDAPMRQLAA